VKYEVLNPKVKLGWFLGSHWYMEPQKRKGDYNLLECGGTWIFEVVGNLQFTYDILWGTLAISGIISKRKVSYDYICNATNLPVIDIEGFELKKRFLFNGLVYQVVVCCARDNFEYGVKANLKRKRKEKKERKKDVVFACLADDPWLVDWEGENNTDEAIHHCSQFTLEQIIGLPSPSPLLGLCNSSRCLFFGDIDDDIWGIVSRLEHILCGKWESIADLRADITSDVVSFSCWYGTKKLIPVLLAFGVDYSCVTISREQFIDAIITGVTDVLVINNVMLEQVTKRRRKAKQLDN
jgi:hypothetical protein